MKTQQLEIKLSNKTEEDIKKARRKSTQAGEWATPSCRHLVWEAQLGEVGEGCPEGGSHGMGAGGCGWERARLPPGLAL